MKSILKNFYVIYVQSCLVCFILFSVASMRLAYKELEIDRKLEEKKLKNLEGKKREQAERLGMGLGSRRYHPF